MKTTSKLFDQFYTNPDVACFCTSVLFKILNDINYKDITFLEPSAGTGVFLDAIKDYKNIKKVVAYDIDPKDKRIEKQDYLKSRKKTFFNKNHEHVVVIGNPPFGKKSTLAIEFVNKSFEYANVIAFIVPLQFEKWSVQSKLNDNLKLIYSERLGKNSFIFEDKPISIGCCFQIWVNKDLKEFASYENKRILTKPKTSHKDFEMYQYNYTKEALKFFNKDIYKWNFAVPRQGYYDYNIRIFNEKDLSSKIQWIFFKTKKEEVLQRLMNIDYRKLSLKNTTIPGFGKADVVEEYERLYKE